MFTIISLFTITTGPTDGDNGCTGVCTPFDCGDNNGDDDSSAAADDTAIGATMMEDRVAVRVTGASCAARPTSFGATRAPADDGPNDGDDGDDGDGVDDVEELDDEEEAGDEEADGTEAVAAGAGKRVISADALFTTCVTVTGDGGTLVLLSFGDGLADAARVRLVTLGRCDGNGGGGPRVGDPSVIC